jgi:hypothetical protein
MERDCERSWASVDERSISEVRRKRAKRVTGELYTRFDSLPKRRMLQVATGGGEEFTAE